MDASTKECPQCGYDYMEFYESQNYIRYICPDCGYTEEVDKKKEKEKELTRIPRMSKADNFQQNGQCLIKVGIN